MPKKKSIGQEMIEGFRELDADLSREANRSNRESLLVPATKKTQNADMHHQAKGQESMADVIREAVSATGQSVYAVAKAAGISQPMLHRFMAKERTITLETAEKLCRYLGLRLSSGGG